MADLLDPAWWLKPQLAGGGAQTLPPAMPGQQPRLPPPTTSPLSDVTSTPAFQLGLPLAASIATAIAPRRFGPAIGAGLQGLNTANYYNQLNRQQQELQKQEEEKKAIGIKLGEYLKSTKSVPGEPQLVPPAPFEDQPTEGPSNLVPTQKQVPVVPEGPHKAMAQILLEANQPTAALKFLEPEKPILQPETSNLVSPTGEMIRPAGAGSTLPKTGDALYVQAARDLYPNDPQKQAEHVRKLRANPSGYLNRNFEDFLQEAGGDYAVARQNFNQFLKETSQVRSQGAIQGQLDVKSTPEYKNLEQELARLKGLGGATGTTEGTPMPPATAKEVGNLESALRQMAIVKQNLNDEFLGPLRGTEAEYGIRGQIGTAIGKPISKEEADFRGALATAKDQLFRAKEGGVIPDAMYRRLEKLIPNPREEPQKFRVDMDRFMTELQRAKETTSRMSTQPRGAAVGVGGTPRAAPTPSQPGRIPKVLGVERLPD